MSRQGRSSRHVAGLSIWALALVCAGCSFRLVRPAPPRDEWPDPVLPSSSESRCTDSALPVAADFVVATILGTVSYLERNSGSPKVALGIGVIAVPFFVSGVYGAVNVPSCRSYKSRFHDAAPAAAP